MVFVVVLIPHKATLTFAAAIFCRNHLQGWSSLRLNSAEKYTLRGKISSANSTHSCSMMLCLFMYYSCIPIYIMMNILTYLLLLLLLLCITVSVLLGYKHSGRGALVCRKFRRWEWRYTTVAIIYEDILRGTPLCEFLRVRPVLDCSSVLKLLGTWNYFFFHFLLSSKNF